ncbi:MAG: type II toxin-antitoxin system HicB family antitoxin [Planctomycetes bacterium]|nr:type II toxin-antitoxin system HicB family antitoxin [Planctomycetota bacterium]
MNYRGVVMQFIYPAVLEKDEDGRFVVSFPDFPECLTDGKNEKEALSEAEDALEEAIAGRINRWEDIPEPSRVGKGRRPVTIGAQMAAKASLYIALRESGVSKSELARRLHCDEKEVRRLLDPHHASKMSRIEEVLSLLGKHLVVEARAF